MPAGRVVLITGASRGFGAAAARLIAARGNTVVATMRNPQRDAPAVREGLEARIEATALDVTHPDEVRAAVAAALARHGRLDAVVNNAGYGLFGPVEEATDTEIWRQLDTNLLGQWRVLSAALPAMRSACRGKIVNVSSLAGRVPGPFLGHYAASKHAVEAMSESLRFETAGSGVEVCVVEPGMYASDWQTTNLDVSTPLREGRSAYAAAPRALAAFRAQAATRPGSASVGAALADVVHLEQRLPLRWPVGNDSVQMTALRLASTDEQWRFLLRAGALGPFRRWMFDDAAGSAQAAIDHDWSAPQVVLVTGASRGFGEAAARECALRGHTVVATMRNPGRDGARVRQGLDERVHVLPLDVTDEQSVALAVSQAVARFGRVDVLVNNAGYGLYGPVEELTEGEVRRQLDTNVLGQVRLLRAVLPHMRERRTGKIVNVSSVSGVVPSPLMGFYAASKHAVEAMSEALADEVEPWGLQVCVLQPGMYRSDWQTASLDLSQTVRHGRSRFQPGVERMLGEFRARAASRPGSEAVAAAVADIVQLQQPVPLRWPVGDDAIRAIRARRATPDGDWERRMLAAGWCFRSAEARPAPLPAV
ncbi:MAG: SDR family NAD(P)-dependent oxidoreductase [Dehalococcoidia bacterium]|nr:SDR family NAD(P)-dependent oxidoreductase [Dehalococcoidia bacterium]